MKAILLKIVPATNTLPSRYIATVQGQKRFVLPTDSEQFDYTMNSAPLLTQVTQMIVNYFGFEHLDYSVGQLPDGNRVITLREKVALYKAEFNCNLRTVDKYYLGTALDVKQLSIPDEVLNNAYSTQLNPVKNYIGDALYLDNTKRIIVRPSDAIQGLK